jgi:hypothetical protein
MSFVNKVSFASLKDAYGILEFSREPEEISYTIEQPKVETIQVIPPVLIKDLVIEKFDEEINGQAVKKHCSKCDCMKTSYGPIGMWFYELVNTGLMFFLGNIYKKRENNLKKSNIFTVL